MSNIFIYECSANIARSILWQDNADTSNIRAMLEAKQAWYDENFCQFWNDWITNIFDLNTANEFGLKVWSDIMDIPLFSTIIPSDGDWPAFGFDPVGLNFDNGNFATDGNNNYRLTTEEIRTVLKLRALQLTTNGVTPEINRQLLRIFGNNTIFCFDSYNMTITYVNLQTLASELYRCITELDLLPRPTGVKLLNIYTAGKRRWGFSPSSGNYDNSNYFTTAAPPTGRESKVGFGPNKNNFNNTNFKD